MRVLLGLFIMVAGAILAYVAFTGDPVLIINAGVAMKMAGLDPSSIIIGSIFIEGVGTYLVFGDGTTKKITGK